MFVVCVFWEIPGPCERGSVYLLERTRSLKKKSSLFRLGDSSLAIRDVGCTVCEASGAIGAEHVYRHHVLLQKMSQLSRMGVWSGTRFAAKS